MKGISKVLLGLGAAAVMVMASMPVAEAQCATARQLGGGQGNNTNARIRITPPAGFDMGVNQVGSIWQIGTPGTNSGGEHFGGGGACPVANWAVTGGMFPGVGNSAVIAAVASPTCLFSACPDTGIGASMITVLENESLDGSSASFIAFTVDDTPGGFRYWDHTRINGGLPLGINAIGAIEFPSIEVTGSAGPPPNTTLSGNYADVSVNVHAVAGGGNVPQPASGSVLSYDILSATSMTDPGRNRSAYTPVKSIAFSDAAVIGDSIAVPCADTVSNTFLAVGVTYADGVQSVLVGSAVAVECDPAHADPDGNDGLQEDNRNRLRPRSRSVRRGR